MTLTAEQLEQRRHGLGSSDIALLVEGRYRQVWLSKVHPEQYTLEYQQNPQMVLGHRLEPFVAQWCSELYEPIIKCDATLIGPEPWMLYTNDYIRAELANPSPWEIKAWAYDFAEQGCPYAVEAQLRWQMICGGDHEGSVGAWNRKGTKPPVRFTFERDTKLEKELLEGIARPFWFGHVVPKKEPPPDVVKEHPRFADGEGMDVGATDSGHPMRALVRNYELRSREARDSKEAAKAARAELRSAMKHLGWIEGDFGKIYHREYPGKTKVEWENVARELATALLMEGYSQAQAIFERIVKQHTTIGHPFRKLIPKWKHAPHLEEQDPEEENDDDGEEVLG